LRKKCFFVANHFRISCFKFWMQEVLCSTWHRLNNRGSSVWIPAGGCMVLMGLFSLLR
jgi:hypothetical protein